MSNFASDGFALLRGDRIFGSQDNREMVIEASPISNQQLQEQVEDGGDNSPPAVLNIPADILIENADIYTSNKNWLDKANALGPEEDKEPF